MLIAHLSDTHIVPEGALARRRFDSAALARRALEAIRSLDPRPDLVVHTGDLTNTGDPAETRRMGEILAGFDLPLVAIVGNHDTREGLREVFAGAPWLPPPRSGEPFVQFTVEGGPVRVLALDTWREGTPGGELSPARLDWLADRLAEAPGHPTAILMHHPPFTTGLEPIDACGFPGLERFRAMLRVRPELELVLCGHVHRAMQAPVGHAVAVAAPSTCYPFALDRRPGAPLTVSPEPPGFCLHAWRPGEGFTSHTVLLGD